MRAHGGWFLAAPGVLLPVEVLSGFRRALQYRQISASAGLGFPHMGQRTSAIGLSTVRAVGAEQDAQAGSQTAQRNPDENTATAGDWQALQEFWSSTENPGNSMVIAEGWMGLRQ